MKKVALTTVLAGLCLIGTNTAADQPKTPIGKGKAPKVKVKKQDREVAWGWQSQDGTLHWRVHTPFRGKKPYRVTGSVCTGIAGISPHKITKMDPKLLEGGDHVKVGPHGHCIWYNFTTNGHIDGFDFRTPAKLLTVTIKVDGRHLSPKRIHLGKLGNHPKKSPFVVAR